MHSITSLAKKSGLPRRTVQYWHDRQIITPVNLDPLVYDDDELRLTRILAAVAHTKPSIQFVSELSRILHLCMDGDDSVPPGVSTAFEAALAGRKAFLGLQPSTMSDGNSEWIWTFGAVGESRLKEAVVEALRNHQDLGLVIVDLQYCFDLSKQVGAVMMEN